MNWIYDIVIFYIKVVIKIDEENDDVKYVLIFIN